MKKIQTEIIINASSEMVWDMLTDLNNFKNWNPFIVSSKGVIQTGTQLTNTINLEGQKPQTFTPTILEVESGKSFSWLGSLFIKGLFDGEHYFKLEKINDAKTRLIHGEKFSGLLSKLILKLIGEQTKSGFIKMNEALKKEVEKKS